MACSIFRTAISGFVSRPLLARMIARLVASTLGHGAARVLGLFGVRGRLVSVSHAARCAAPDRPSSLASLGIQEPANGLAHEVLPGHGRISRLPLAQDVIKSRDHAAWEPGRHRDSGVLGRRAADALDGLHELPWGRGKAFGIERLRVLVRQLLQPAPGIANEGEVDGAAGHATIRCT